MCSMNERILVVRSSRSSRNPLAPTEEMLERLKLSFETVSISSDISRILGKKRSNVACLIVQSSPQTAAWVQKHYPSVPTLLVPCENKNGEGLKALIDASEKEIGEPMPTFAVGKAGAVNAALFAAALLALRKADVRKRLLQFRKDQTRKVLARPIPGE